MIKRPDASIRPRSNEAWIIFSTILLTAYLGACGGAALPEPDSETYRETVSAFYAGLAAIESGVDRQGEENLLRVTELAPGEPAAWVNLGLLAMRRNDYALASEYLQEAETLAPENSVIRLLLGLFEKSQGNGAEATRRLQEAAALDSTNAKALYALVEHLAEAGRDDESAALLDALLHVHPDNGAALVRRAGAAARSGDSEALRNTLAHIETLSASWPEEALEQLTAAVAAASGPDAPDFATATTHIAFLRNVLLRVSAYRQDLRAIQTPVEQVGDLMTGFLRLPEPPPAIAPRDEQLTFTPQSLNAEDALWRSVAVFSPAGGGAASADEGDEATNAPGVALALADENGVHLPNGQLLEWPGSDQGEQQAVAGIDYDYDFTMDLALVGAGGLRLFRQDSTGTFAETTSQLGLPAEILTASLANVWAADLDLEGDVDLVAARTQGAPLALRNNGDGTFAPLDLFGEVDALRAFAWGDFDGDGDPDPALVDANGTLHLFANRRSGLFARQPMPETDRILAVRAADLNGDATVDLAALRADGTILRLSTDGEDASALWSSEAIARWEDMPADIAPGAAQLFVTDLDNNGGLDLTATTPRGARLWLRDADEAQPGGILHPTEHAFSEHIFAVADLTANGRLDLIGFSETGAPIRLENEGSKPYHWKQMHLRAAEAVGDQRINSFGIGGEVEIRAGLSFQKQVIEGPLVHFGLGTHAVADVARIVWPNGSVQAEFDLLSGEVVLAQQRLKGSCPWLFAWNGERMDFVTDFIWRSPLGLKINAQETAGVMTTEDWVRIRGEQLAPRPGENGAPPWYDLRITAELWETHFFDHVSLLVVDHPDDTEIYVDERFAFPPPEMKVHVTALPQPLAEARDDLGQDVTDLLAEEDGRYLATFGHGQYQGVTRDHYVELTLENIPGDAARNGPVWLVASGWIYPTDSSINVALAQGSHVPPQGLRLDVSDGKGGWRTVHPNLGFPAGKTKTVLIDLTDALPAQSEGTETLRLRLHTNLEIFWDAFAWAAGQPDAETMTRRLLPDAADLRYRGFSETYEADAFSPELPVYDELAATGQVWRDLVGYHTRFGDVRELLETVDDRYVIMNAADEMAFRFEAPPPPPDGWTRDFVLVGDGWVKDGDYNTGFSKTVLPLPSHDDAAYATPPGRLEDDPVYRRFPDDWARYHTRYVTPERFHQAMRVE